MVGDMIGPGVGTGKNSEGAPDKRSRERSKIEFPYGDLDDALEIARAIHENVGTTCSPDQLAGFMHQTVTSGAFRTKVGSARIFGLIETARGSVSLAPLGQQIVDHSQERDTRTAAFLSVPLYKAIFDKYRGHMLPPRAALEREMANLGVAQKQTSRARQAFERSAEQAGFFAHGSDRLIVPSGVSRPETAPIENAPSSFEEQPGGGNGDGEPPLHPFIRGLLETLPPPKSEWSVADQAKWLETAANIFGLIYVGKGSIKIEANDDQPS